MKFIRSLSVIISWLTVLVCLAACGILIYAQISKSTGVVDEHVRKFIDLTLTGGLGFISFTINGVHQSIGQFLHGLAEGTGYIGIIYIVITAVLSLLLIWFAISDNKLVNALEFIFGFAVLILISWMIAIPLIVAAFLKLATKKTIS